MNFQLKYMWLHFQTHLGCVLDKGGNLNISHCSVVGTGKNNLVCYVEYPKL